MATQTLKVDGEVLPPAELALIEVVHRERAPWDPTWKQLAVPALAQLANEHHRRASASARTTLEEAAYAGHALRLARQSITDCGWLDWLAENFDGNHDCARVYMRIARYRDLIPEGSTQRQALLMLRGLPGDAPRHTSHTIQRAVRMRSEHVPYKEIAARLEVSVSTVHRWINGANKRERRIAANAALKREQEAAERVGVVARVGGALAEAHSMAERLRDVLAQAAQEAENPEVTRALTRAGEMCRGMADEMTRALGHADGARR